MYNYKEKTRQLNMVLRDARELTPTGRRRNEQVKNRSINAVDAVIRLKMAFLNLAIALQGVIK